MKTEQKLVEALMAFLGEIDQELAIGPLDYLVIPLKNGDTLTMPMIKLVEAGEKA